MNTGKDRTLSSYIGNIRRKYPSGDFNPFDAMDFVYGNCLTMGHGSIITVVGYSPRFQEQITQHVACNGIKKDLNKRSSAIT